MTDNPWDTKDPYARLALIAALEPGWNGRRSVAIDPGAIDNFRAVLDRTAGLGVQLWPMPTAEGVGLEWDEGSLTFFAETEPGGQMFLCRLDMADPKDDSKDVDYQGPFDVDLFLRFLSTHLLPEEEILP